MGLGLGWDWDGSPGGVGGGIEHLTVLIMNQVNCLLDSEDRGNDNDRKEEYGEEDGEENHGGRG